MYEGGSVDEASLSEEAPCRGPWEGGSSSLGTLEDTLRKSPDTGISLHGGTFPAEGSLVCVCVCVGGGCSYTEDFESNNPICRKCGAEEETSVHILCQGEALVSLRRTYLGSFFF